MGNRPTVRKYGFNPDRDFSLSGGSVSIFQKGLSI